MGKTHVRSARDLRNHYREIVDLVKTDHDHVIITNQGRGDIVIIDYTVYSEFEEFLHEKYVAEKLQEGILRMNDPNAGWLSSEEVVSNARDKLKTLAHEIRK